MRIVLNGVSLISSGGMVSAKNLISSLSRMENENKYLLLFPEGSGYEDIKLPSNFELMLFKRQNFNELYRLYLDNMYFPKLSKDWNADVFFTLCNLGPYKLDIPHLVMVRKPYFVYNEDYLYRNWAFTGKLNLSIQKKLMYHILKNCNGVTVQTQVMKERIMSQFNLPTSKVSIVPNALMEENLNSLQGNTCNYPILENKNVTKYLALAQYYPHKNLEVILDVAADLIRRGKTDFVFILTVDPKHHPNVKLLLDDIKKRGLERHIINIGVVPSQNLPSLYKYSDYLFMPTVLETFGNPYVEAMYSGVPVLTSDLDFAHCMCGEAAVYFNPFDPKDIADKMLETINNPYEKEKRKQLGIKIVEEKFISWDSIAERYLELLSSIANPKKLLVSK